MLFPPVLHHGISLPYLDLAHTTELKRLRTSSTSPRTCLFYAIELRHTLLTQGFPTMLSADSHFCIGAPISLAFFTLPPANTTLLRW
ncbi:hypothetical protein Y032_0038g3576 [Ancylostoma ceylanicum]|uniref:Uncharacterized protein n=1 Tax=Ancylostoma ceylanicum TaxID=53326 RepID=A0A016UI30_9BILA|nr:hypothetical protein Y032_0038g3576 [Ancylostoma ceylanicum]